MSVAGVHRSSSLSYLQDFPSTYAQPEPTILSIEELRLHLYSCFTCGVCWLQDHVCLDCVECGGYSLQRPCLLCDGRCGSVWKRDLTLSHGCGKARWIGNCQMQESDALPQNPATTEEDNKTCTGLDKVTLGS